MAVVGALEGSGETAALLERVEVGPVRVASAAADPVLEMERLAILVLSVHMATIHHFSPFRSKRPWRRTILLVDALELPRSGGRWRAAVLEV